MTLQGRPAKPPSTPRPPASPLDQASAPRPLPLRANRTAIITWLIAIGMAFLIVPLVLINNAIRSDTARINTDLDAVVTQINTVPTPVAEIQQRVDQITQVQSQTASINALSPTLTAPRYNWPAIGAMVGNYDPNQIDMGSIAYDGARLTLSGHALNDVVVTDYARRLEQSGVFNRVIVQSIKLLATPVITATSTITPGATITVTTTPTPTVTPSPTTDPRDEFEPDNTVNQAKPLVIGVPQLHNFYPSLDVDTATVLIKAGRFYRIYTTDLGPGVDTFLSVSVGDVAYTNDDAKPGTVASEVVFQNTGADTTAVIRVTNRGQSGADKGYQLIAEEIVPTPTPTPGPSPTPTNTPTLPPDLRDAFEPDDIDPKPILPAQPQVHNFYPDGDVDQVNFLAKSGRFYHVFTTDLAPGVDTFLTISVGGATYTNDDAKPGTLASDITFQVTGSDTVATVRVTNRGQYGADKRYQLVMEEFLPTPTVPAPSTATPSPTPSPTTGVTPVPTQDLRDHFEPDDVTPAPIAIGEIQAHNFYPFGDVDKVTFNAKNTHVYQILTSDLALGVDTLVTVTQGGGEWHNDDYASAGSNNFASAVCFTATVDAAAVVTITNQQPLFDPTKTYSLTVSEVPTITTAPCLPPTITLSSIINAPAPRSLGGFMLIPPLRYGPGPERPALQHARQSPQRAQRPTDLPVEGRAWASGVGVEQVSLAAQPPRSIGWQQPPPFLAVEFVIILELKVTAP
jgi:hypothetical protein